MEQNTSQEGAQDSSITNSGNTNDTTENNLNVEQNESSLESQASSNNEPNVENRSQVNSATTTDSHNNTSDSSQPLNRENSVESILPFLLNRLNSFYLNAGIDLMQDLFDQQSLAENAESEASDDEESNVEAFFNVGSFFNGLN